MSSGSGILTWCQRWPAAQCTGHWRGIWCWWVGSGPGCHVADKDPRPESEGWLWLRRTPSSSAVRGKEFTTEINAVFRPLQTEQASPVQSMGQRQRAKFEPWQAVRRSPARPKKYRGTRVECQWPHRPDGFCPCVACWRPWEALCMFLWIDHLLHLSTAPLRKYEHDKTYNQS